MDKIAHKNNGPHAPHCAWGPISSILLKNLVDECVVDGGDGLVGVGFIDDDADLDFAGGIILMLIFWLNSASNIVEATPEWLCIPAPTMETFAQVLSTVMSPPPMRLVAFLALQQRFLRHPGAR